MFKKSFLFLISYLLFLNISAEEIKGIWITRWDIREPLKVFKLMDNIKKYDINTLFVQVYARGEAMYKSKIAPRSLELLNAPFSYDPLDLILKIAHRDGYKVHVWVNLFYVWSYVPFPATEKHISNSHPEWFIGDSRGVSLREYSVEEIKPKGLGGYFLEPGNEEVREYLRAIIQEIVENYDIDGVHLDYCRYPGRDYGYDIPARVKFMREYYVDPLRFQNMTEIMKEFGDDGVFDLQERWNDWRREQVTLTIELIYESVKRTKPEVQVSAAVIGDIDHATYTLFQDWSSWARTGCVDFVVPMLYSTSVDWVERKTKNTVKLIGRDKLVVGLGAYLQNHDNILQEIIRVESLGVKGYVLFSYGGMLEKGYFD